MVAGVVRSRLNGLVAGEGVYAAEVELLLLRLVERRLSGEM
jgi:hypothetical protein